MKKISSRTISRALLYIRTLESLIKKKQERVSSAEIASIAGLTDVQVRKDISAFGKIGVPRVGYNVVGLKGVLEEFILEKNRVGIVIFGVGNLGKAILSYFALKKSKIKIVAAFEKDEKKVGKDINKIEIFSFEKAKNIIKKYKIDMAIIAVPVNASQEVADIVVDSGIKSIINFAPTSLVVPKDVTVKEIDLLIEFLSLYCDSKLLKNKT